MTNKVFSLMCSQEKASKPRYFNKPLRLFLKMSRPEIPGFYFDETRNRYFKLTTARTGVTASTEYSSSSQATLKRKAESTNTDDDGDGEDISNIGSHIYFDNIAGLEPPEKYPNGMVPTLADRACWSMAHAGNNSRGKRTLQNVLATSLLQPFDFIDTRRLAANSLLTRMVVLDNETILYGNNSGAVNSVSFDAKKENIPTGMAYYFQYLSYMLMSGIVIAVSPILISLHRNSLQERLACSATTPKKQGLAIGLGCITYCLAVWLIFMIIAVFITVFINI